jgi:hypothetical protein
MAINRKATMAKRQREMDQKDRVKQRETRQAERQARTEARKAAGLSTDPIDDIQFDADGRPIVARTEDGLPVA